jgi:hypothetical protein
MNKSDDLQSISTTGQPPKKDWLQKWIHKLTKTIQTDENKKIMQVFLIDPVLNYILERIFPYILILCVLFVILTVMISLTLLIVFTRVPAAFGATVSS